MKLDARSRLRLRVQNNTFLILVMVIAGLLAWLSTRYSYEADWTANRRHTLSATSQALLTQMPDPIHITAYTTQQSELRDVIRVLVTRYQRHKKEVILEFIDPNQTPGLARTRGIRADGELIIEYQGRNEHLTDLSETGLSRTLQRLVRSREQWIVFLSGHGERDPLGQANHDYGNWGRLLSESGLNINHLNFSDLAQVPDNTALLVIAEPRTDLLPTETDLLRHYVKQGGALLWLLDPGPWHGLEPLAADLGISRLAGQPVDPVSSQLFNVKNAYLLLLVSEYAAHPLTQHFTLRTLFPEAAALRATPPESEGWVAQRLFSSHVQAWTEKGDLNSPTLDFDPTSETSGPLDLAFALTRPMPGTDTERQQRVVVVGDGDFLSNAYLENSGNLELGMRLVNWLTGDDSLVQVPARISSDLKLDLSPTASTFIGLTFLIVLPLGLLGSGLLIWWHRRKQ